MTHRRNIVLVLFLCTAGSLVGAVPAKPKPKPATPKSAVTGRTPANGTLDSAPAPVKGRVRSISGIRHINAQFLAAKQGIGAVTSISLGWGPRLMRTEGGFFEVRGNLGASLLKRISPDSLFIAPELWILGSVKIADKARLEAGPLLQYWLTKDQGLNFGATVQLAYEVKWVTYFDRVLITYQPVFNKVALTHFFRLGLGLSL